MKTLQIKETKVIGSFSWRIQGQFARGSETITRKVSRVRQQCMYIYIDFCRTFFLWLFQTLSRSQIRWVILFRQHRPRAHPKQSKLLALSQVQLQVWKILLHTLCDAWGLTSQNQLLEPMFTNMLAATCPHYATTNNTPFYPFQQTHVFSPP